MAKAMVKMTTPETTTSGPGRMLREEDKIIPEIAEIAPKTALRTKYLDKLLLMILEAAAGVTTRKPTRRVPVT